MPHDADLVVAGAGAAGCAAALAAAERGAAVVLLDASETFRHGCNTAMSTSMIPAGGSRWQAAAGIDDSPERFADDVRRKTDRSADPTVTAALTQVAPQLVAWLADHCGVGLGLVTDFRYPGHSRDRCHAVADRAGRTLHGRLLGAVERAPGVTLAVPLRLTDVVVDGDGVRAEVTAPGGAPETIAAAAVVLATNGYGANPELVRRYAPEIAGALYHGGDGSTGDALRIGERLNADTAQLDAYQGHGSVAVGHNVLVTWATVMHGATLVNVAGRRFGDETTGYSEYGARVVAQAGGVAWVVFDDRVDRACRVFADYADLRDQDAITWCDGVGELAATVGCERAALEETLEDATAVAAAAAADPERVAGVAGDPFGRTFFEEQLTPPYAVVKVTGALFHTQGGLRVDGDAQVLRGGAPIGRVYAAGGAALGMSGRGAGGYLAGNGLLAALGLGYLAGRHACR